MRKGLLTIIAVLAALAGATAQNTPQEPFKYWVRFTDKQGSPYTLDNPGAYLSQRALERRGQ